MSRVAPNSSTKSLAKASLSPAPGAVKVRSSGRTPTSTSWPTSQANAAARKATRPPEISAMPGAVTRPGIAEISGGRVAFRAAAFACEVGQDVDVGVRPEDLTFTAPGAGDKLAFAKDFVEELGATRLIHGSVGAAAIVVAVATSTQVDSAAALAVDPAAVHLFDMKTGASLRRGTA